MSYKIIDNYLLGEKFKEGNHSCLTLGEVKKFIADETKRMYGKSKNINFIVLTGTDYKIFLNRKQFLQLIINMQSDDNGLITPNYDDNNLGLRICLTLDETRKMKTQIVLFI